MFSAGKKLYGSSRVWLWVMAGLLVCNVYFAFTQTAPTNADLFVWPYFFQDLFSRGFSWAKWTLPPSGYLFPDLPLCALLWFVSGQDPVLVLLWQHLLYAGLFVWGFSQVVRRYLGWSSTESWFAALFVALCVTNPLLIPPAIMTGLMGPASHGQSTLMFLWGAIVLWELWRRSSKKLWCFLVAITFLGCLGDRLFALWFVAPVLAVSFLCKRLDILAAVFLAGILGAGVAYAVTPSTGLLYMPTGTWRVIADSSGLPTGWPVFVQDLVVFWHTYPAMCATLIFALVAGGLYLWRAHRRLPWWTMGLAVLIFAPFVLSLGLHIYDGAENWRHFPFIVPLGLLGMLVFVRRYSRRWSVIFGIFSILISLPLAPLAIFSSFDDVRYPSFVHDFDSIKRALKLKDGLSSYWFAKQTNLLTREGVHLAPLWKDGRPNPVLSTLRDYENRDFNYIIAQILWMPRLIERFGQPERVIVIQNDEVFNRWTLMVYPPGALNRRLAEDPLLRALAQERHVKLQVTVSQ